MAINEISALIISMAPTISAVVGIIVSLIVGIKKIKASNNNVVEQLKADNEAAKAELLKSNKQIIEANAVLITSNEQLRYLQSLSALAVTGDKDAQIKLKNLVHVVLYHLEIC